MLVSLYDDIRLQAGQHANREDTSLWRRFSALYQDGRIRWVQIPEWLTGHAANAKRLVPCHLRTITMSRNPALSAPLTLLFSVFARPAVPDHSLPACDSHAQRVANHRAFHSMPIEANACGAV
ncbi:hypothetical protein QFZ98_000640 [Paraburkholderia youngii]